MNYFAIFTLCVTIGAASAWPQRQNNNQFFQNQGSFPNQGFQGQQPSGQFNPGFGNSGGQNQGFGNPGFGNQGFGSQGGQNQGFGNPNGQNQGFGNPNGQNQGFGSQNGQGFQFNPNNPFLQNGPEVTTSGTQGIVNQPNANQPGQFQNPTQNQVTSTTPAAAPAQSQPYLDCNRNCLTTFEYNPVCGSDQVAYTNERRLDCANQCGRRVFGSTWQEVSVVRRGACASGQRVS